MKLKSKQTNMFNDIDISNYMLLIFFLNLHSNKTILFLFKEI